MSRLTRPLTRAQADRILRGHSIDVRLHPDVRGGFQLQVPARRVLLEVLSQRALDVPGPGVVALDQVAVVRVHDANEIRQVTGRPRVERSPERGCGGSQVGQNVSTASDGCSRRVDSFIRLLMCRLSSAVSFRLCFRLAAGGSWTDRC